MQETVGNAGQTQQWAFILSQLFDWVMAGLAWIVPFQSRIFGFVLAGDSFWSLAGTALLLLLPAGVFVAAIVVLGILTFVVRRVMVERNPPLESAPAVDES